MDPTIIAIICFSAIVFTVLAGYLLLRDLRQPAAAGVAVGGMSRPVRRRLTVFDQPPADGLMGRLDQFFERLVLESGVESTPTGVFLGLFACGLLVGGTLFVIYDNPLLGALGMGAGMAVPTFWLMWKRSKRMHAILEELPHVVDLLARAVRAGESVDQAIDLVGTEFDGPLGREFARASRQLEMGRSLQAAMKTLSSRVQLLDIRLLASVLSVHRQTGGHLPETLERLSGVIRQRLNSRRQMRAATAAGRFSAIVIVTAAPLVYIAAFMWNEEHYRILYDDPTGRILLLVAFCLEVIGIIWVLRILRTD
ncbi:MAG: type II secretion system F family protein [Planctomycetales bacterium]